MSSKGKALFVVHSMGVGGVESLLVNIANGLVRRGYTVDIVVTSKNLHKANHLRPEVSISCKVEKQFPFFKKIPYLKNYYEPGMWSERKTPQSLYEYFVGKEKIYDVEIAFFFGKPLKIVYGSPNINAKKILWIHSDYKYCTGCYTGFENKEDALKAYNFFDEIVCVSKGVQQSFKQVIGREHNVSIIRNLNNVPQITSLAKQVVNIEHSVFTFVAVGRLSEEKGFLRLLEVAKRLNNEGFIYDIWIVGDGVEKEGMQKYVSENRLLNVKMVGAKDNPYPYIRQADMLVSTSFHEAYGLTIAEAFILGRPVLSTDCVGPRELLDDGKYGILVENTTEGIYEGMKSVLIDKKKFTWYCDKAKERRKFFDSDSILDEIEQVIN